MFQIKMMAVVLVTAGEYRCCSQVNIILLPDPLSHQFAFSDAQCFLAAHNLTFLVLVHLDVEGSVNDSVPT